MQRFKQFSINHPFLFGIALIFLYALLTTLTFPVHYLFPDTDPGQLYGDAISKLIIFLVFVGLLGNYGWLEASGIARSGKRGVWLITAGILVYKILTELFAFTGDISVPFPDPPLALANTFLALQTNPVEETMYRGLVLTAMLLAWGSTKQGQVKAVLLSSLLFGLLHMFNIIVRPVGVVLFQAVVVTLPDILYAALVLTGRSLWPAILIHWLSNAAVNAKLIGAENYQETFWMWVIFALLFIPLVAYSVYLIWKLPKAYQHDTEDTILTSPQTA